jgi:hypothetical protein
MTDFRNISSQNVISILETGTTQSSVSILEKGNTQYPEISSLVAGDGITISKNSNDSVIINSSNSTPDIRMVDLTETGKIEINDAEKGLENSELTVGDQIFNFCNILDHNDYVELNGSVSLVKATSDLTGTLIQGKTSFVVTIKHDFPEVTYEDQIYMGGSVSHYTNINWITGARILPPTNNNNKDLNGIELEIATTKTAGSQLPDDIEELEIRFSLMYKK